MNPNIGDYLEVPTNIDLRQWLPLVIDSLSTRERDVINGIYYENVSMRTLARRSGEDEATIRRLHAKALVRIGERLQAIGESLEDFPDAI